MIARTLPTFPLLVLLLAACGPEAWERDPAVQAVKKVCKQAENRYSCVERHAVETLNPDLCRLAGIWIDDMCLQAVYQAAGDPAICERLYLEGVRPTCRAYYEGALAPVCRHSDSVLGFAAEVPSNWQVGAHTGGLDPLGRPWSQVEFRSELHAYGHEAFNRYGIRVGVSPRLGRSLTETVEIGLSRLAPGFRDQIEVHCCLQVGGEPALELLNYPPTRWGNREIVVLHQDREYRLDFFPLAGLTTATPAGVEAQAVFEAFLRAFSFIPVTATPHPPPPTVTPVPTPSPTATGTLTTFRTGWARAAQQPAVPNHDQHLPGCVSQGAGLHPRHDARPAGSVPLCSNAYGLHGESASQVSRFWLGSYTSPSAVTSVTHNW